MFPRHNLLNATPTDRELVSHVSSALGFEFPIYAFQAIKLRIRPRPLRPPVRK